MYLSVTANLALINFDLLGLVSGMDFVIGEIVKKLKDLGMYDNTYILFSSDVSILNW